jgi:hypothetical protein
MLRRRDQAPSVFPSQAMAPTSAEGLVERGARPLA